MLQIRARRLAKLGGPPASATSSSSEPTKTSPSGEQAQTPGESDAQSKPSSSETSSSRPNINITPAPTSSSPKPNPFTKLGVQSNETPKKSPESSDAAQSSTGTKPRDHPRKRPLSDADDSRAAAPPPSRKPNTPQPESDADYVHRIITQIFRVSVDPHVMSNTQGHRLVFLPGVNEELNAAGAPLKLTIDVLEQAIMEAANTWPHDKPLMGYLLPCWKRAVSASASAKTATGVRQEVHEEAKRLCMSNCLFALTMPDLYGSVHSGQASGRGRGHFLTSIQARA